MHDNWEEVGGSFNFFKRFFYNSNNLMNKILIFIPENQQDKDMLHI